jgi:hypothetical protein
MGTTVPVLAPPVHRPVLHRSKIGGASLAHNKSAAAHQKTSLLTLIESLETCFETSARSFNSFAGKHGSIATLATPGSRV